MKDPAFLFYSSDFLTGVSDLTMEERGQYITLLCMQHQKGHLSEKTCRLILGLPNLSLAQDVMKKFKKDENGLYYNERLEQEVAKRAKSTEASRLNGTLGGRPKKEKEPDENLQVISRLGFSKPRQNLGENENESVNANTNDLKKGGSGGNDSDALFDEFWAAYPKRRSKGEARKAWKSISPSKELVAIMLEKLARATTCHDWTKDNGRFIPYPATWLRSEGWHDEITPNIGESQYPCGKILRNVETKNERNARVLNEFIGKVDPRFFDEEVADDRPKLGVVP